MFRMEQRRDERIQFDRDAWITIYGNVERRIPGQVRNVSGRGIGLEVDEEVTPGSALKVEIGDVMMLGEVIYCSHDGLTYYLGIELDQAVHSLVALSTSVREFRAQNSGGEQAYAVHEADGQN